MNNRIQFENETPTQFRNPKRPTTKISRLLVNTGIVKNQSQATLLLVALTCIFFLISFFVTWPDDNVVDVPDEYFQNDTF